MYNLRAIKFGIGIFSDNILFVFVLRFKESAFFSVMSRRSHRFLAINQYFRALMCLAQGHNTMTHMGIVIQYNLYVSLILFQTHLEEPP